MLNDKVDIMTFYYQVVVAGSDWRSLYIYVYLTDQYIIMVFSRDIFYAVPVVIYHKSLLRTLS